MPPLQATSFPEIVTVGLGFTVTEIVFEFAEEQAFADDPVNQYEPVAVAVMEEPVDPLFHVNDVAPEAVRITFEPEQNVVTPPAVTEGVRFVQHAVVDSEIKLQFESNVDVRSSPDCPEPGPGLQRATKPEVA